MKYRIAAVISALVVAVALTAAATAQPDINTQAETARETAYWDEAGLSPYWDDGGIFRQARCQAENVYWVFSAGTGEWQFCRAIYHGL